MSKFLIIFSIAISTCFVFHKVAFSSIITSKKEQVLKMQLKKNIGWKERLGFKGEEEKLTLILNSDIVILDIKLDFVLVKNTEVISSNIPETLTLFPNKPFEAEVIIKRAQYPHLILRAFGSLQAHAFGSLQASRTERVYLGQAHFYRKKGG